MNHEYYAKIAEVAGEPVPALITPEWLAAVSLKAEATMANGRKDLAELHWVFEECGRAATWMRKKGLERARYIGAVRANPFKRGDFFTIPKGGMVHSTRTGTIAPAGRSHRVKLHDAYQGHSSLESCEVYLRDPSVVWAGAGGYWMTLDLSSLPEAAQ